MNRGDAIAAARALLPWWVTWLNVLVPAVLVFVYRGLLARALAENGDCEAARRSLAQARRMVPSG